MGSEHTWKFRRQLACSMVFIILFPFLWQGAVAEIAVQQTNLAEVRCFTAIMSMSGNQKANWWHFLPYLEAITDNAFIAYMISNFTHSSTGACDLEAEVNEKSRLLATNDAAIAEHRSVEKIRSLGKMEIHMWALGYACLDASPNSCERFTPVVMRDVGDNKVAFFSLWEWDESAQSVTNSFTARVLGLPVREVKPSNSEMSLRVLTNPPELCEGLSMQDNSRSIDNSTILINSTRFKSKLDVKLAAEAAGFDLTSKSKNFCSPAREKRPLCLMGIESLNISESLNITSTQYPILLSFMSHVKNSYVQAQNSALQLKNPGTDFWMAAIALPSAFIAVLVAAVPFINMQLRVFRSLISKTRSQRVKVFILCICNTILSGISYSAAIALIPSELQKQKSFKTWGLLADQVPINRRLQVLVVVEGKSTYFSYSLLVVVLSSGVLLPAVVCITVYRCQQVFRREKLLKDLRELESEYVAREDLEEKIRVDDLEAIEMTNVEEHLVGRKVAKLRSLKRRTSPVTLVPVPDARGGRLRSSSSIVSRS